MSDEREFLECEIADAMENDRDCRLEVALIIRARSQRDEALALLAQRDGEIATFEAMMADCEKEGDRARTGLAERGELEALRGMVGRIRLWAVRCRTTNAAGHTAAYDLREDISAALDELADILSDNQDAPDIFESMGLPAVRFPTIGENT